MRDRLRVLLVEDSEDDQELLKICIEELNGYHIELEIAANGREAIASLENHFTADFGPQLLIVDLKMPDMDGHTFLREFRARKYEPNIPVLVLTTSRAEQDVFQAYRNGCNGYYRKPLEYNQLQELMAEIVRHWTRFAELPR